MGMRSIAGNMLNMPSKYCSVGCIPQRPAARSQKRPRANAMRRTSAGWLAFNSVVMASVAKRRKVSSPTAISAVSIEVISCRMAQIGELTRRSRR